jgi:hypothetical protein
MSDKSDDPRDAIATREMQRSDWDEQKTQRKDADRAPAEVRTLDDDLADDESEAEPSGNSGGNGVKNG